jgi:hypothetical protein
MSFTIITQELLAERRLRRRLPPAAWWLEPVGSTH